MKAMDTSVTGGIFKIDSSSESQSSYINSWLGSGFKVVKLDDSFKVSKNDKSIMSQLITQFIKLTGFEKNKIIFKRIHGWKYSYNYGKTPYLSIWNKKINLGVCGDWLSGPKVENAWLSAYDLAKKIK